MCHIFINITGQCSKGVAPSVSHPPIPLYNHLTLPRSLTWLLNIPLSHDSQPDNRSPIRPCFSQTGGWLRFLREESLTPTPTYICSDTVDLDEQRWWGDTHSDSAPFLKPIPPSSSSTATDGCGRIQGRIAQLSQDRAPTPTPIPNEVRWPDVVYLPVTTAAMKLLHTSMLRPGDRGTSLLCACARWKTEMEIKAISSWNPP